MASIPSNKQGQRLSGGAPVQAINPANSPGVLEGRQIQQLSQGVANLASGLARYKEAQRKADRNLIQGAIKIRSEREGQNAEQDLIYDNNKSPDGSDLRSRFQAYYRNRMSFVEEIEDPEFRSIAKAQAQVVENKYSARLLDQARKDHVANELSTIGEVSAEGSVIIQKDPSRAGEIFNKIEGMVDGSSLHGSEKEKIRRELKKDTLISAVIGLNSQGRFDEARELMDDPEIARQLGSKGRSDVLQKIESEQREYKNDLYRTEKRELERLDRERADEKRNLTTKFMQELSSSDTFDKIEAIEKNAKVMLDAGVLDGAIYNSIKRYTDNVGEKLSKETQDGFLVEIVSGKNKASIEREIQLSVGKTISGKDAQVLLNRIQEISKKEQSDPGYKLRKKQGDMVLESAVPRSFLKRQFMPQMEMLRAKYEAEGMDTLVAAHQAKSEVMGFAAGMTIPGVPYEKQNSIEALDKLHKELSDNARAMAKNGKLNSSVEKTMAGKLRQIIEKKKALEAQAELDQFMKTRARLKNEGGN